MIHNLIIIGAGPAGLTAGIYAGRAKLEPLIIEGLMPGGQLMTTTLVENWPGETSIQGPDLMIRMRDQAVACGSTLISESVTNVNFDSYPFILETSSGKTLQAKSIIIATGAVNKKLNCIGEAEYWGKGVSTCATCDAPFYENKEVVIVGGGNTAMTEAEHLSHFAKKITIVHILESLTANDPIKDKVLNHPNISIIYNATITEINGNGDHVTNVVIENKNTKNQTTIPAHGCFIAIGFNPNTTMFKDYLQCDQYGYLVLNGHTKTSINGIFAAGDVADYRYRQAITSAGVGCMAALDAQAYLSSKQ